MKRRGGSSTRSSRLVAQQSSANQSVTLFKLEDPADESLERDAKRVKVEADATEVVLPTADDSALASPKKAKGKSKGKAKEIKQALDTPHPAPARWRETYDAIREMRARMPAPVDTMGCDTAKWKETDPRVRPPSPPPQLSSHLHSWDRTNASRRSSRSCCRRRLKMK
jgi:endonuclease-3